MNFKDFDFSSYAIDVASESIVVESRTEGARPVTFAFDALFGAQYAGAISRVQWRQIWIDIEVLTGLSEGNFGFAPILGEPESSKWKITKGPGKLEQYEHTSFGTLLSYNKDRQEAIFRAPDETELTINMDMITQMVEVLEYVKVLPKPKPPTADDHLKMIVGEIAAADDPFKAAGQWITKVTNAITEAVRDSGD